MPRWKKSFLVCGLLGLMACASALAPKPDSRCPDFSVLPSREVALYGELSRGRELLLTTPGGTQYRLCGQLVLQIAASPGDYLFARGLAVTEAATAAPLPFRIEVILLQSEQAQPDWSDAALVPLSGLLERGQDNIITLVTNWSSRSRVSHYLLGPLAKELAGHVGQYARLRCYRIKPLNDPNPWAEDVIVDEVLQVTAEPPE